MSAFLDNPVWNSLIGPHREVAIGQGGARRYSWDMAPFVAIDWNFATWKDDLRSLAGEGEEFVLLGGPPDLDLREYDCLKAGAAEQMVYEGAELSNLPDLSGIVPLDARYADEMLHLTQKVYPGYFRQSTFKMGRYYGVFSEDRLIAMAGERMRPAETLQELSGICTLPEFRGQGWASKLTLVAMREAIKSDRRPFLHVDAGNAAACYVYERLGFKKRTTLLIRKLVRKML